MIKINQENRCMNQIAFIYQDQQYEMSVPDSLHNKIDGKMMSSVNFYSADTFYVMIGLGNYLELTPKKIKSILAKGVKRMKELGIMEFSIDVSLFIKRYNEQCLVDIIEGIKLGLYQFSGYKTDKKDSKYSVLLHGIDNENIEHTQKIIDKAENLIDGVILARDMVNTPANRFTPSIMSEKVLSLGNKTGFSVEIIEEEQLEELGMKSFLTVGKSSGNPPKLIVMRYCGNEQSNELTALVGKGVTCDTGGYCVKPGNSMLGIKGDMAGGAAVIGAIYALAKNKVKTNVVGIIPACENRISRESFIPGDVINSMSGKTIEIINTDAEGRLILADAVTYAIEKENATKIVDIATLTGAVASALGVTTAGVLTNNQEFYQRFKSAYKKSGEQYWQLPIYEEYRDLIKSDIADIKNCGKSYLSTITAGLFIEAFVEKVPWIHLDIAGTAWVDPPVFEYQSTGATGAAVTSLYFMF